MDGLGLRGGAGMEGRGLRMMSDFRFFSIAILERSSTKENSE